MRNFKELLVAIFACFMAVIILMCTYLGIPTFLTFLILRLCNVIAWNWWLVCLPLILWVVGLALYIFVIVYGENRESL